MGKGMKAVKWVVDTVVDMLFRGVIGLVLLYLFGLLCRHLEIPVFAGVNLATFGMIAVLGIPGFFLAVAIGLIGYF